MSDYRGYRPPQHQRITNALPPRYAPDRSPLPCRARIVWETDGEETVTTKALRYDPKDDAVFVDLPDARNQLTGVWLRRRDVFFTPGSDSGSGVLAR